MHTRDLHHGLGCVMALVLWCYDCLYCNFLASPPSEVTQLHVVRVTSISIEISWSPPENDGGDILLIFLFFSTLERLFYRESSDLLPH